MPWIYERPNEYVVFCFVFYIKKSLSKIVLISIAYNLLQWFSQSYFPNFLGHEPLSANLFYHGPQSYVTSIFCPINEER